MIAYTNRITPNIILLVYEISTGMDFHTNKVTAKKTYNPRKTSPKTNRNRC